MKLFKLALGAFALLLPGVILFAQTIPEQMPLDAAVRIGRLDNGLTYYLRHHENPKDRADFYIVHNVGAMQEEDSQNGLAQELI